MSPDQADDYCSEPHESRGPDDSFYYNYMANKRLAKEKREKEQNEQAG